MWFRNLPLGLKFGILTAITLCSFLAAVLTGGRQVLGLNDVITEFDTKNIPSIQYLSTMRTSLADYRTYEYRHILTTDEKQMSAVEALLASERAHFVSAEHSYKSLISDSLEQHLFAEFKEKEQQYLSVHEQLMSLSRTNRNSEAFEIIRGKATNIDNTQTPISSTQ
jgi:methyl-accepting chemotaxis protein